MSSRISDKPALQDRLEDSSAYGNPYGHGRRTDRPSLVRGGSLLDRLSDPAPPSAVPSKRGRGDMFADDVAEVDMVVNDGAGVGAGNGGAEGTKRARWKGANSGERGGGGGGGRGGRRASFTRRVQ